MGPGRHRGRRELRVWPGGQVGAISEACAAKGISGDAPRTLCQAGSVPLEEFTTLPRAPGCKRGCPGRLEVVSRFLIRRAPWFAMVQARVVSLRFSSPSIVRGAAVPRRQREVQEVPLVGPLDFAASCAFILRRVALVITTRIDLGTRCGHARKT